MTMMAVKVFVDTNVLLRAMLTDMDLHVEADGWLKRMWQGSAELWISGQVIREFLVQATHPRTLKEPLPMESVIERLNMITPLFQIADETATARQILLELLRAYPTRGKQVHDVNIVATMLASGVDRLVTLNTGDMKRFADRITLISLTAD